MLNLNKKGNYPKQRKQNWLIKVYIDILKITYPQNLPTYGSKPTTYLIDLI